jgi:putative transcriptional regulator
LSYHGHPSPELLRQYAAGELSAAPALVVACHLEACTACAAVVAGHEYRHGAVLAALPDATLSPGALDEALAAILDEALEPPAMLGDVLLPQALIRKGFHARRFIGRDYWIAPVRRTRVDGWRCYVVRAPAGTRIMPHRHLGREYFQVLMGEVTDDTLHRSGDFVVGEHDADHALQVSAAEPCACLIAAEHGSHWNGATAWLAPLLRV